MKKIITSLLVSLFSIAAFGATTVPSTLINWISAPSAPSQTAKFVFAAPNASAGAPTFRQLTASDIASLGTAAALNTGTSGATIPLLNAANTWALGQAFTVRPTFNGATPYDTGNLTIANYLTTASAASTYATITQATTALAATGGSINGVTTGLTTPLAGKFTTLSTTAMSRVKASTTNAQSIPNNAFTTVTTWTATQNQGSNFVASSGIYTAPVAGDYDVRAAIRLASVSPAASSQFIVAVLVNGSVVRQAGGMSPGTTAVPQASISTMVTCNASDTISVQVFQNTGVAATLDGSAAANWLMISQLP